MTRRAELIPPPSRKQGRKHIGLHLALTSAEERTVETATDVLTKETYQPLPTIVFNNDTLVESGTVLSPVGDMRVVQKQKKSRFYLSPYINKPSKIGRRKKGKLTYHALGWLGEAKYMAMSKWLKDKDGFSKIKGGTTTLTKSFFIDLLRKNGYLTNEVISLI